MYEFVWKFTDEENLLDLPFESGECAQEKEKSFDIAGFSKVPVFDLLKLNLKLPLYAYLFL